MTVWLDLDKRLKAMEQKAGKPVTQSFQSYFQQFTISPTCPPSKQLRIRPGIASPARDWGWIMVESWIPEVTADFEDSEQMGGMDCNFSNSGWYLPILLCYEGDWVAYRAYYEEIGYDTNTFDNVIGEEVSTTGEAEAAIDLLLNGGGDPQDPTRGWVGGWMYYRFPLTGIVLKNNGQTGVDGAIEPVGMVNRGGSYLYRDIRYHGLGLTS